MRVDLSGGIMSSKESYCVEMQKSPIISSSPSGTPMRLVYSAEGTAVYKPVNLGSPPYTGSGGGGNGHNTTVASHGINMNSGDPVKRKRGRPRKYGPDGSMALALTPVSLNVIPQSSGGGGGSGLPSGASPPPSMAMKKARGRPPGSSSKKQQMAALGSAGIGFTPHVITVKAGEDVSSKIMSFSQNGPRAICILSANGAISNVTLRQAATSGGTVTYEGRFEILSLSGSFLLSESGGQRSRTGGLSVSLAGPDGRVLGGGVAGILTAASPVQVIVGSFITDGQKVSKPKTPSDASAPPKMVAQAGAAGNGSPTSRGTLSESSGGPGSPLNQSTGTCNNNVLQGMMANMPWK